MNKWRCFPSTGELDRELAQYIAGQLCSAVEEHGKASLALSGGSTPKQLFRLLSQCELDWSRVWISLVDERWVPPQSPDSNEHLVRENLLQNRAAAAHFIGLKTAHDYAGDSLAEVDARLADLPQPVSLIVLGMGGDGHTASWFPQASNLTDLLDTTNPRQVAATKPVTAPHERITLTLTAVLNSRDIIVHITGEEKKSVLESAQENRLPIASILQQKTTPATIWWAP